MQVDFCHPASYLYVPGADEDGKRFIRFIYDQGANITQITCSLDSHLLLQIFHPVWWADSQGNKTPPFTTISRAAALRSPARLLFTHGCPTLGDVTRNMMPMAGSPNSR